MTKCYLQKKLNFLVLFEVAPIETQLKIIEYSRQFFDETFDEHYEKAVVLAKEKGFITHSLLKRELDTYWGEVNRLLAKLKENKIIATEMTVESEGLSCYFPSLPDDHG